MGHCMDVEKTIADIAFLEELYALPDERPILTSDGKAASPKQDELYGRNLWLSLWLSSWNHLQWLWSVWRSKRPMMLEVLSRKQCLPHECTHDQTPY